jgi:Immunoglobulin I-set domain
MKHSLAALIWLLLTFALHAEPTSAPITNSKTKQFTQAAKTVAPAIAAFQSWANRYVVQSNIAAKTDLLSEGLDLAKQRRKAFADLIRSDPAQALSATIPAALRARLPPQIINLLETPVSGIGDFTVLGIVQAQGGSPVEPIQRFVHLNGQSYRAFVYGRRSGQTTKNNIPLHGVVLDGLIALHESALRELEPDETPDPAKPMIDLRVRAQKLPGNTNAVFAEMEGRIYQFSSRDHLRRVEARIEAAESRIGPNPTQPAKQLLEPDLHSQSPNGATDGPPLESPYTQGGKNVLIIRVDFSDLTGNPHSRDNNTVYTVSYVQNLADTQIKTFYQKSSYGLTSLTNTVTTQLYRMPQPAAFYATNDNGNNLLHINAQAAASANYILTNYDRIIVLFSPLDNFPDSMISYGGLAQIGGPWLWVNGEFDFRVVAHELGHTYGLFHANLWQVNDGNPISNSGFSSEYKDDFDTMGANFANDLNTDFNPWFKTILDWIQNSQVLTVTNSGTYRINRFDNSTGAGSLALKVVKDGIRNYWIGCRRSFTNNPSMQHGAYVMWGYNINQNNDLLDMNTPGTSDQDAALAIGQSFDDMDANLTILPMAEGGTAPNEYLDVQVLFHPKNQPPDILAQPQSLVVFPGADAQFSVTVQGSFPLFYQWRKNGINLSDGGNISGSSSSLLKISNASASDAGSYSVAVSNGFGSVTSANASLFVYTPLVQNGDFESGDFSNWTSSGNLSSTSVSSSPTYVHSGNYAAILGPVGSLGYLSQTVPTLPGQSYLLSFWLTNPNAQINNEFLVAWNGITIFDRINIPTPGWTNMQFVLTAEGTSTLLTFGFRNDPGYFGLDDISVIPLDYYALEAESGMLMSPMSILPDPLASQGQYIASPNNGTGSASYTFNILNPGQYVLWCRVLATNSNVDSFFVSLDGGSELIYDAAEQIWSSNWQWTRVIGRLASDPVSLTPRIFDLLPGAHTVTFRARDSNTKLDRLLLTNNTNYVPVIGIEAESGVITSPMAIRSDPDASRGQYVSSTIAEQGQVAFTFGVPVLTNYYVWCHVLATNANADSFYVSVDTTPELVYDVSEGTWTNVWQWTRLNGRTNGGPVNLSPRIFSLAQTNHTLVFRTREAFAQLDRLLLVTDATYDPNTKSRITIDRFAGNFLHLSYNAEPGLAFLTQATTNLLPPIRWNNISTNSTDWRGAITVDTQASGAAWFFRVLKQ